MQGSSVRIEPYTSAYKPAWDAFVTDSKNATFLFYRDYMDYHADRFQDSSLLIYDENERLVALFPASIKDTTVTSHAGLTYGGILSCNRMTAGRMLLIFTAVKQHYAKLGISRMLYKAIPSFYATVPTGEDLYALFIHNATLIRRDITSTIFIPERLPFAKGKKYNLSKARKAHITVRKTQDYATFWEIETQVLKEHNAVPVHSLKEITSLAYAFPNNIQLFGAFIDDKMVAGIVVYQSRKTAHAQYMGANADGLQYGALDAIIAYLLDVEYKTYLYFDFGISTEDGGKFLNQGLIAQKEMLGGRAATYDHYEMSIE
ncbi:MAG TPA: GNAT family N-acetyltransferase [Rickettsiales bacterium]|nr:GNAT family N-acetyltransferase [Rickettsiales bacterium]